MAGCMRQKFLSGIIAGSLTDNDKVAYIADYPIYGMIANINAFALGVECKSKGKGISGMVDDKRIRQR